MTSKVEWLAPDLDGSLLTLETPPAGKRPRWIPPGAVGDQLVMGAGGFPEWQTPIPPPASGMANPMLALGDLIYGADAVGTPGRLGTSIVAAPVFQNGLAGGSVNTSVPTVYTFTPQGATLLVFYHHQNPAVKVVSATAVPTSGPTLTLAEMGAGPFSQAGVGTLGAYGTFFAVPGMTYTITLGVTGGAAGHATFWTASYSGVGATTTWGGSRFVPGLPTAGEVRTITSYYVGGVNYLIADFASVLGGATEALTHGSVQTAPVAQYSDGANVIQSQPSHFGVGSAVIQNNGNLGGYWDSVTTAPAVFAIGLAPPGLGSSGYGKVLQLVDAKPAWGVMMTPIVSPGDLIVGVGGGVSGGEPVRPGRLFAGTTGQVLTVLTEIPHTLGWVTPAPSFGNPMTALGDLIAGGASGAPSRLGIGSAAQVLTVVGGVPAWATLPVSPGFANPMTTLGDLIAGGAAGAPQRLGVGSPAQVLTVVGGVPAWATLPVSPGFANPMTTLGDLIIGGAIGAPGRLGIGTASQLLTVVSGAPAWATPPAWVVGTGITAVVALTQTAYNALSPPNATTLYVITGP
jgi:hypothetical protein